MVKILLSADWHILLKKKSVPYDWQKGRFEILFDKLLELENSCDIHIMAGDLFDKRPTEDEVALALKFLNRANIPTYIIPGNHEATKKGESFLSHFTEDDVINNPNVTILTKNTRLDIMGQGFQFFPYGEMQLDNVPHYIEGDILVTHIRGEVPPHISAEFDFEKLRPWKMILLGDLHFNHKYKDFPAYYPGSPLNVVFDRNDNRKYGIYLVDSNTRQVEFIDLKLPKLLRKTVKANEELVKDDYHHIVYEVTGTIDELALVANDELLDKKISQAPTEASTLDLEGKEMVEELEIYLKHINVGDTKAVIIEYNNL